MNFSKLSREVRKFVWALRTTTTNCRVSFINLYLVFPKNFRIVFLPHASTVILLEPYCGITCSITSIYARWRISHSPFMMKRFMKYDFKYRKKKKKKRKKEKRKNAEELTSYAYVVCETFYFHLTHFSWNIIILHHALFLYNCPWFFYKWNIFYAGLHHTFFLKIKLLS